MKKTLLTFLLLIEISWATDHTKEAPTPEVLNNIQLSAKEGNPQAQFELGCILINGEYLPRNAAEAFRLFLESAKQGYAKAQYKVGICYFNGEGVLKDQKEGLAWVYLSILEGLPTSICESMESIVGSQSSESSKQRSKELIALLPKEVVEFINLKSKAPEGDPEIQYKLGLYYENRRVEPMSLGEAVLQIGGIDQRTHNDTQEAVKWISMAADQNYAPAQNELANLYSMNKVHPDDDKEVHGSIPDKDAMDKAIELYRKAALQGYANAQENLGNAYAQGQIGEFWGLTPGKAEADKKEAVLWHEKAANQGYALAQYNLGECYKKGEGVEKNLATAVYWYRKAAEKGNFWAQSALGDAYLNAQGVDKSLPDAIKWYEKAGAQGDNKANRMLGNLYIKGNGVEKNPKKAVEYWEKAAGIGGDEIAMRHLGDAYFEGNGVSKNLQKAYEWHHRSGNLGDLLGAMATGDAHKNGWGTEKSIKDAKIWYAVGALNSENRFNPPALERLSELGVWPAALILGEAYLKSKSSKGVDWMKKAASHGSADAKYLLANAYFGGEELTKDQIEGLAWMYITASSNTNNQAVINSEEFPRSMPFNQAVNFGIKHDLYWSLKNYMVDKDEIVAWDKDPNQLITIAKVLSEKWEKEIGRDASLKAQQRAKDLSSEIIDKAQ